MYRQGDKVANIDTSATPGSKARRPTPPSVQAERNERFAELQEMLYANSKGAATTDRCCWCCRAWTPRARAASSNTLSELRIRKASDYTAFGVPTEEERKHHYLWRIRRALPAAGDIGVFDRSHYEDVLVVRVHNMVPPEVWGKRYDEINKFERKLVDDGTTIVKVAMFVSLDEQKKRLVRATRAARQVLEVQPEATSTSARCGRSTRRPTRRCSSKTSTDYAPWHVVPCDRKWYSRLAILELLIEALEGLNLSWPPADFDVEAEKKRLAEA